MKDFLTPMIELISNPREELTQSSIVSGLPKILVGICSCSRYPEKRQAVRETWLSKKARNVEYQFFIGGERGNLDESDTVVLSIDDSYDGLPEKVIAYFAHALATSDFEWLFKCDDDTYLVMDRLHDLVTVQGEMIGDETLRNRGSPSGGAGYLLSRRIVEKLVNDRSLSARGAEDIIVGEAAVRHGAIPVWTSRLRWNAKPYPRRDNNFITAHWCSPERLHAIHTSLYGEAFEVFYASAKHWSDELELHENGIFCRKSSGCNGHWERDQNERLALRWFDWDEEIFIPEDKYRGRVITKHSAASDDETCGSTIVVWQTFAEVGLPHLGRFLSHNPGMQCHVIHGEPLKGEARKHAWRNCDRMIRSWWLNQGNKLDFDRAIFLEWDVLFDARIEDILPDGDFVGKDVKYPKMCNWHWFQEIERLPTSIRTYARGIAPLAVLAISRRCLDAMMTHPLAEDLFSMDIFCELRLPTLAACCGFEPVSNSECMPNVQFDRVLPEAGGGVWHSVKA